MTESEAHKASSVRPWPSLPGPSVKLKGPQSERRMARFIVRNSEMLVKTGRLWVSL